MHLATNERFRYGALMLIASDFTGAVSVIQFWDDKVGFDIIHTIE